MSTTALGRGEGTGAERPALSQSRPLHPELGDAVLYLVGALFALITILGSSLSLYRVWGKLAIGPYLFGALAAAVLALAVERRRRREAADSTRRSRPPRARWVARSAVALVVFVGATAVPLALEVLWRSKDDPGSHVQPEVQTIEKGGQTIVKGKDPYRAVTNSHGKVVYHAPGVPTYEGFLPYLPLMTVFGIPSERKHHVVVTDARIFFSVATLLVMALALALCRADGGRKMRVLQVMAVLPTAALPLATGGDDMPIVAFLLLAMVLAQRRQPFASGVVLGIVSAMKFTAWPLAGLALFAARDRRGERRPGLMALGMLVVIGPVVVPFALRGPWAFFDNVVLFPLGLSGVTSPAASPLPGHLLVQAFPALHRALPLTVGVVGGALLAWRLWRRPPANATQVCTLGAVVMAVIILLAPATRIGYLLYPINFFVWAHLFRELDRRDGDGPLPGTAGRPEAAVTADTAGTADPAGIGVAAAD